MCGKIGHHSSRALCARVWRTDLPRMREWEPTALQERPLSRDRAGRLLCTICCHSIACCCRGPRRYGRVSNSIRTRLHLDLTCTGVTPAQAAVTTDAVLTAYHAVKRTGAVKSTDTVVIFGLGGLGFNALQIVLALGSRVIVMDKREEVLIEAINFGVPKQDVIPVGKDPVEFVREHKLVVDVVIDFVGVNDTFAASQQLSKSSSFGSISSVTSTDQVLSQVCG